MKRSNLMKERIRRVNLLFLELGYHIEEEDIDSDIYTAGFSGTGSFGGVLYIDRDCRFLEIAFSFFFSPELSTFIQSQIQTIQDICYEFGSYYVIKAEDPDIVLSIHSKLYYVGLNYFSLKETLRDLSATVSAVEEQIAILFDPDMEDTYDEYS